MAMFARAKRDCSKDTIPECICDNPETQKTCAFFSGIEPGIYCRFNYNVDGQITELCHMPGINVLGLKYPEFTQ